MPHSCIMLWTTFSLHMTNILLPNSNIFFKEPYFSWPILVTSQMCYRAQLLVYNLFFYSKRWYDKQLCFNAKNIFLFLCHLFIPWICYSHKFRRKPQGIYIYIYIKHIHAYYSNLQNRRCGKFQCSVQLLHSRQLRNVSWVMIIQVGGW